MNVNNFLTPIHNAQNRDELVLAIREVCHKLGIPCVFERYDYTEYKTFIEESSWANDEDGDANIIYQIAKTARNQLLSIAANDE